MFKFFNKKNNETKVETNLPTAKEMVKKTSANWPTMNSEEILEYILKRSADGNRDAWFLRARISKQARNELLEQGYSVWVTSCNKEPCFRVRW